jgi:hypothetical protein
MLPDLPLALIASGMILAAGAVVLAYRLGRRS